MCVRGRVTHAVTFCTSIGPTPQLGEVSTGLTAPRPPSLINDDAELHCGGGVLLISTGLIATISFHPRRVCLCSARTTTSTYPTTTRWVASALHGRSHARLSHASRRLQSGRDSSATSDDARTTAEPTTARWRLNGPTLSIDSAANHPSLAHAAATAAAATNE
jgi:hypothetical protein